LPSHAATEASPGYRPRAPRNDLKEIVEDALEELVRTWDERFRDRYGALQARVRTLLERFLRCGDLHFGFLRLRCVNPECRKKAERLVPFSCKSRGLCPSCGQRRAMEWAERMVEEVLPRVPYRQLVFTVPIALRKAFIFDRTLYGDLCRLAYACTLDYLRERAGSFPGRMKAVPAMVVSPQSHGDLLTHHPHAHSVSSLGLFRPDGTFLPMEDVDFEGLEELFRERFFQLMLRRRKVRPETVERLRRWEHSGFNVDSSRRLEADDRQGLEGLLSYMERAPVSLRRLTYRSDGLVHYQGTKFHPRLGIDHQLLTPVEFLAMLVPHILLRYQIAARCYGAASPTLRRKLGWLERPPVDEPPAGIVPIAEFLPTNVERAEPPAPLTGGPRLPRPSPSPARAEGAEVPDSGDSDFLPRRRRAWAKLIARTWKEDPGTCNSCGRPMKIVAALSSPHQDDVIERILRHLHLWDPPWKRFRPARGPPPGGPPTSAPARPASIFPETSDPIIDDDLYCVDPIPPDDDG
jgi:hypothetical protein